MSKEFMNEATLKRLIEKIKSEFIKYSKKEDLDKLNIPIVDEFLSETSGNAIQNKVVTERLNILSADTQGAVIQIGLIGSDVAGIQQQINQHAHFKGYFSTNAKIQATAATPNDFAYSAESGTKWVYDEADGWQDTGTPVPDQMTPASDTTPLVNGEASVGTENAYARGDHRHPSDPTKASVAELNSLRTSIDEANTLASSAMSDVAILRGEINESNVRRDARISAIETNIGDIDAALEELHNYAQNLIGGAE